MQRELDKLKERYESVRNRKFAQETDLENFFIKEAAPKLFSDKSVFKELIDPMLFLYENLFQFKDEEFNRLFEVFFQKLRLVANELEKNLKLSDQDCFELEKQNPNRLSHPFNNYYVNLIYFEDYRNKESEILASKYITDLEKKELKTLKKGKALWIEILKMIQVKENYFLEICSFEDQYYFINNRLLKAKFFLDFTLLHNSKDKKRDFEKEELMSDAFRDLFNYVERKKSKIFNDLIWFYNRYYFGYALSDGSLASSVSNYFLGQIPFSISDEARKKSIEELWETILWWLDDAIQNKNTNQAKIETFVLEGQTVHYKDHYFICNKGAKLSFIKKFAEISPLERVLKEDVEITVYGDKGQSDRLKNLVGKINMDFKTTFGIKTAFSIQDKFIRRNV